MQEIVIASDVFLGMEQFDLSKKVAYAKRICRDSNKAMKRIDWIENHTSEMLMIPIYEAEFKLKAILSQGMIPLDVIGEVNRSMGEVYGLLLDNQKEGLFD